MGGQCGPSHQDFKTDELEEFGIKLGSVEEAFEEGHVPCRAVVPMMMINCIYYETLWDEPASIAI
jgi:hypothetical protein